MVLLVPRNLSKFCPSKKKIFQIVRFFLCLINQLIYFSLLSFVLRSVLKLNFHASLQDLGNPFVKYLLVPLRLSRKNCSIEVQQIIRPLKFCMIQAFFFLLYQCYDNSKALVIVYWELESVTASNFIKRYVTFLQGIIIILSPKRVDVRFFFLRKKFQIN